jgi:hypothetical protein
MARSSQKQRHKRIMMDQSGSTKFIRVLDDGGILDKSRETENIKNLLKNDKNVRVSLNDDPGHN